MGGLCARTSNSESLSTFSLNLNEHSLLLSYDIGIAGVPILWVVANFDNGGQDFLGGRSPLDFNGGAILDQKGKDIALIKGDIFKGKRVPE